MMKNPFHEVLEVASIISRFSFWRYTIKPQFHVVIYPLYC